MNFSRNEIDRRFFAQIVMSQIASCICYGIFFKRLFSDSDTQRGQSVINDGYLRFAYFQSTHLMVVFGFALLLTFLQRHRLATLVTCLWTGCLAAQYYFIWNSVFEGLINQESSNLTMYKAIGGEFCSASVLIAVCAIVGKATNYQLFLMIMIFVPCYCLNEVVILDLIQARDIGGSMVIHTFGACFGLAVAYHFNYPHSKPNNKNLAASQASFTTSLIGTIVLWALWPSFNSAQSIFNSDTNLSIINTYFSLNASVVATLLLTVFFFKGKFDLEQVANATLAGGVIIGSSADMIKSGFAANLIGVLGGLFSTTLFNFAPPILQKYGLHDVAGIFNLHCIPGILGGIFSTFCRSIWIDNCYFQQIYGLIFTVILSCCLGFVSGMYLRRFHSGTSYNEFYNDIYFFHLKNEISEKLLPYVESSRNSQKELFETVSI